MVLVDRLKEHFWKEPGNLSGPDKALVRDFLAVAAATLFITAAVGKGFFKMNNKTALMTTGAGAGFALSYATEQDGYLGLLVVAAVIGLGVASVDAMNKGRFYVNLDLAQLARLGWDIYSR